MPTTPEQLDFALAKSFVLCSLQPTKSACSAAAEKCLSGVGQPLSSVSGRKRYNTLDFASKIVCQQGCFSPLLETQSQGISPLWIPPSFSHKWYPHWKNCVLPCRTFSRKCHSTRHSFLQRLCKNLNLCRGVPSKNSVFANTENFLVTLLRQKNNSGLFVDSTWSAISKIFFKKFQ